MSIQAYIVGQDIPVGTYRIEQIAGSFCNISIYSSYTDLSIPFYDVMLAMDTDDWDNAIGRVYLGNGNCIKLDATCRFIPFEGI